MTKQSRINNLVNDILNKSCLSTDIYDLDSLVNCAHLVVVGRKVYSLLAESIMASLMDMDDSYTDAEDRAKIYKCRAEVHTLFAPWKHSLRNYGELSTLLNQTKEGDNGKR